MKNPNLSVPLSVSAVLGVVVLSCFVALTNAYLPVIMMHGIFGSQNDFNPMIQYIQEDHPGTLTVSLPLFANLESIVPMPFQTERIVSYLKHLVRRNSSFENGWHMVCHSQGALLCRAVIEAWDGHNVKNYVSLAGPHMGQYGADLSAFPILDNVTTKEAYLILYTKPAQDLLSVANYWNDPYHQSDFLNKSSFLPYVNNLLPSKYSAQFKDNFVRLENLVLLGSSGDGVITPWYSSMFSYLNDQGQVVKTQQQPVFTEDLFGLQTLAKSGRVNASYPPGVYHTDWLDNRSLFNAYILPYLT